MIRIEGVAGLSEADVRQQVQAGARFVVFRWALSILVLSFRRTSPIYFVRPGERPLGWKYTALTLVVGWWGFPWGPISTIQSLLTNLRGGIDVTVATMVSLGGVQQAGPEHSQQMPDRLGGGVQCAACGHLNGPSRRSCKRCRQDLHGTAAA